MEAPGSSGVLSQLRTHLKAQIESKWEIATAQGRVVLLGELAQAMGSELESEIVRANNLGFVGEPMLRALARCLSQV